MTQKQAGEQRLEELIAERGMSQRQLAEKAGVSRSVISLALHGASRIHRESASKLAKALEVKTEEILAGEPGEVEESGGSTMRLLAGQTEPVDYPRTTGAPDAEGVAKDSAQASAKQATLQAELPPGTVSVVGLQNIRSFRELAKTELARRAGVSTNAVARAEQKRRTSEQTASSLARALSVDVADLAEVEQGRFPGKEKQLEGSKSSAAAVGRHTPPQDTAPASATAGEDQLEADSIDAGREGGRGPLRLEIAEPVLRRVDRILDLVELVLRWRR